MTDLEQAARAEAERRWPDDPDHTIMAVRHMKRAGFEEAASWLAEHLLSDESVERAARALYEEVGIGHESAAWAEWGHITESRRNRYRSEARAALTAALGTNHNEQEQT